MAAAGGALMSFVATLRVRGATDSTGEGWSVWHEVSALFPVSEAASVSGPEDPRAIAWRGGVLVFLSVYLPISRHISPYLDGGVLVFLSVYLPISPHISPYLDGGVLVFLSVHKGAVAADPWQSLTAHSLSLGVGVDKDAVAVRGALPAPKRRRRRR